MATAHAGGTGTVPRRSPLVLVAGTALAALLLATAAAHVVGAPPAALAAALALAAAGLAARVARFVPLARAAGVDASTARLGGMHLFARALDVGILRGVGSVAQVALLARRGARVRDALGLGLALLALDAAAVGLVAVVLAPGTAVAAAAVTFPALLGVGVLIASATPDRLLPAAWRDAGMTPRGVVASALRLQQATGAARVVVLTMCAWALEAAAAVVAVGAFLRAPAAAALPAECAWGHLLAASGVAAAPAAAPGAALVLLVGAGAALAWAARPAASGPRAEDAPLLRADSFALALIVGAAAWWRLLVAPACAPLAGMDAAGHAEYVHAVLAGRLLPLAPEFQMAYHPPLYYWLAAPVSLALGPAGFVALSLAASLVGVVAVHAVLRRAGVARRARLAGAAFAAWLPVHALVGTQLTNEALAALAGALVLVAATPFLGGRPTTRDGVLLGLAAAAAALTKLNAFVVAGAVALAVVVAHRGRLPRPAWVAAAVALALAAPLYARNWLVLGTPLASNMDYFPPLPGTGAFRWSDLVPSEGLLSGDPSASDFWGVLVATTFRPLAPIAGAWDARALVVALALAAVAAVLVGAAVVLRKGSAYERALLAVAAAVVAAQVAYYARYPHGLVVNGQYLLPALPAFALLGARGAEAALATLRRRALASRRRVAAEVKVSESP